MNGRDAEIFVAQQLQNQGWNILAQNFRVKGAELDLVIQKDQLIVAIEVKFRRHLHFVPSQQMREIFNAKKISFLKRGLDQFVERYHLQKAQKQIDGAVVTLRNRRFIIIHYLKNLN